MGKIWHKSSSRSGGADNCVEARYIGDDGVQLRDSKDPDGPVLTFTSREWDAFIGGAKDGEFDL